MPLTQWTGPSMRAMTGDWLHDWLHSLIKFKGPLA
jgi:hypothetical protein